MDLFQAWFFGDWRSRMFMERTPVAGELQLFVNIDVLISEDFATPVAQVTQKYRTGTLTITYKRRPARQRVAI